MSEQISAKAERLNDVFSKKFDLNIPSYQRPYVWTKNEAEQLFDDIFELEEAEKDYFLGSIVLIKNESNNFDIIDGQQRLTTLTILLAVLASKMKDDQKKQDLIINRFFELGDELEKIPSKPRLTIRDKDQAFFAKYIQGVKLEALDELTLSQSHTEAQRQIKANCKFLCDKVDEHLGSKEAIFDFAQKLLLKCSLIVVTTLSQESAFKTFSVMNSRGLDLLPSDILKSEIIGAIPENKQGEYTETWEEWENNLQREDFNTLFSFIRMIYVKKKAQKGVIEEFKKSVWSTKNSTPAVEFFDNELSRYAAGLMQIRRESIDNFADDKSVQNLLYWLNQIEDSDWVPPAIRFLSLRGDDLNEIQSFFKKLERLAAYLSFCRVRTNDRIERHAKILTQIEKSEDLTALELTADEKRQFFDALNGNVYVDFTQNKRGYVVKRLERFLASDEVIYDWKQFTIEHVLPQNPKENSEWMDDTIWSEDDRKYWLHKIANLVPLNRRRNAKAQNYDFSEKRDKYFGGRYPSPYVMTGQVRSVEEWTPAVLQERQAKLMEIFAENWDLE